MALVPTCTAGNAGQTNASNGLSSVGPLPECQGGWTYIETIELVESAQDFQISQLDPAILGAAFGAGWIIVATAFVLGRPVAALLGMIGR